MLMLLDWKTLFDNHLLLKVWLRLAAEASPGGLLEMQNAGPTLDLLSRGRIELGLGALPTVVMDGLATTDNGLLAGRPAGTSRSTAAVPSVTGKVPSSVRLALVGDLA